jgi:hypothetical protein
MTQSSPSQNMPPNPQEATRLSEALDRLIDLYQAMGKADEAKKWQAERAKYPDPPKDEKK